MLNQSTPILLLIYEGLQDLFNKISAGEPTREEREKLQNLHTLISSIEGELMNRQVEA